MTSSPPTSWVGTGRRTWFTSLEAKVFAVILLVSAVVGAASGYLIFRSEEKRAIDQARSQLATTVGREAASIRATILEHQELGARANAGLVEHLRRNPARDTTIDWPRLPDGSVRFQRPGTKQAVFVNKNTDITPRLSWILQESEAAWDHLAPLVQTRFLNFYFDTPQNTHRSSSVGWIMKMEPDHDFTKDLFYSVGTPQADPSRQPRWTSLYYDSGWKTWMTTLVIPVYLDDEFIGTTGSDYNVEAIFKTVRELQLREGVGTAFIYDNRGSVVAHPAYMDKIIQKQAEMNAAFSFTDVAEKGLMTFLSKQSLAEGQQIVDRYLEGSTPKWIALQSVGAMDWNIGLYADEHVLTSSLRELRRKLIAIAAFTTMLIALALRFSLERLVLRRLRLLGRAAAQIGAGNLDVQLPEDAKNASDQIGHLMRTFDRMTREMKRSLGLAEVEQMFEHMRQGVLAFDRNYLVSGRHSQQAATLLGRSDLRNRNVLDLLFEGQPSEAPERKAFVEFAQKAFTSDAFEWDSLSKEAPEEVHLFANTPEERLLLLEFRPLTAAGRIGTLMILMSDETEKRRLKAEVERRTLERNRDMRIILDNVAQGFLTTNREGVLSNECSRTVDNWFGMPTPGMTLFEYVSERIDPDLGAWLQLGWESILEDVLPLDVCIGQLPKRLTHGEQMLEIEYRPVLEAERFAKMLVVISDVTERALRERADTAQREMVVIFRHMLAAKFPFQDFVAESSRLVDEIERSNASELATVKRLLHTLKGNSGLFGIESIAMLCHELEERLATSADALTDDEKGYLASRWRQILDSISQLQQGAASNQIELQPDEHARFLSIVRSGTDHRTLASIVASWPYEPARARLERLGDQARALAKRLGKGEIDVSIEAASVRIPSRKWAPFWSAFAHVLRNAVDHGLASPEEVAAQGAEKPAIWLKLEDDGQDVVLSIRNNGHGIDWDVVAKKAEGLGLPHDTRQQLEDALFVQGFTTRDVATEVSGRGIGLRVVKDAVAELGGRIQVDSNHAGTTFRFVFPRSVLVDSTEASMLPPPRLSRLAPPVSAARGAS